MKSLLASILIAASIPAAAQSYFARAPREGGGEIVLLHVRGNCTGNQFAAYIADRGGNMMWGCWTMIGNHFHVLWENGRNYAYDDKGWTLDPYFTRKRGETF